MSTAEGLVAIDAGTTEANALAARSALGPLAAQRIATVILTQAHWDHIGGLAGFKGPGVQTVAQANFATEQQRVNETGVPFRYFFGRQAQPQYRVVPDKLVAKPETLTVGGVEFRLYPIHGGETDDGLLVYLPASGVLFVGDALMPYLGAPFLPEGSPEGLFDTIALIRCLNPRILVHGHVPLTELYTLAALPGFVRDNSIKRMYHQHTGYWKPDGQGMEVVGARQWAAALNIPARRGVAPPRRVLVAEDGMRERAEATEPRLSRQVVIGAGTREAVLGANQAMQGLVASGITKEAVFDLLHNVFAMDILLTNLGPTPYDSAFGELQLDSLWGPAVLGGLRPMLTIGAASTNGALCLLATSHEPIPRLLETAESILATACAQQNGKSV